MRAETYVLHGLNASPYSVKLRALMRYRRIPHVWRCGMPFISGVAGVADEVKVKARLPLVPVLMEPGADVGLSDTTPIIQHLEAAHAERSVVPSDPVLRYLALLIEDYADEWLSKIMFHYRWGEPESAEFARLWVGSEIFAGHEPVGTLDARADVDAFGRRQVERRAFLGSGEANAPALEAHFHALTDALLELLGERAFVLGDRPTVADFALYGQLRQMATDVVPARIILERAPELLVWLDRLDDASGLEARPLATPDELLSSSGFAHLLRVVGSAYTPFMAANARALLAGEDTLRAEIGGLPFSQAPFGYHAKCYRVMAGAYHAVEDTLPDGWKARLSDTDCAVRLPTQKSQP